MTGSIASAESVDRSDLTVKSLDQVAQLKMALQKTEEFFKNAADTFIDNIKKLEQSFKNSEINQQEARKDLFKIIGLDRKQWDNEKIVEKALKKALQNYKNEAKIQVFMKRIGQYTSQQLDIKNQAHEYINELVRKGTATTQIIDAVTAYTLENMQPTLENLDAIAEARASVVQEINRMLNDMQGHLKKVISVKDPMWNYFELDHINTFAKEMSISLRDRQLAFEKNYENLLLNLKEELIKMRNKVK